MVRKVLVIGSRGMLGRAVLAHFVRKGFEAVGVSRTEFDIAKDGFDKLSGFLEPAELVVNCAGVIKPQIAKTSIEDVLRVNAIFPRNLATRCQQRGSLCVHITTDCVYSGRGGNYDENALFDADDVYGMTKNAGEPGNCMVLRTSIIGEEAPGQQRSLLEWARSQAHKEVNGFTNHRWNGVTTLHLGEVIEAIAMQGRYRAGIVHVFSPQAVTKLELLHLMSDAYELDLKIKAAEAKEACDRSLGSIYDVARTVCTKPLAQQLREMRAFFRDAKPA